MFRPSFAARANLKVFRIPPSGTRHYARPRWNVLDDPTTTQPTAAHARPRWKAMDGSATTQSVAAPAPAATAVDAPTQPSRKRWQNEQPGEGRGRGNGKGKGNGGFPQNRKAKKTKAKAMPEGGHDEVLLLDIQALLSRQRLDDSDEPAPLPEIKEFDSLPPKESEIELEVYEISSTGDGLALGQDKTHVYVVPFTAPGDVLTAKIQKHFPEQYHSTAEIVSISKPSDLRDDSRIKCQYFGKCAGCQFQMLDYDQQLEHKKRIVEKAYKNFSNLSPELVPGVLDTMGSPLQYGYRTKLTPHFDGPPGCMRKSLRKQGIIPKFEKVPEIGFMPKGARQTLDIEDCPIGTDAVRLGIKSERARVAQELDKYRKGATLLLRENTVRLEKDKVPAEIPANTVVVEGETHTDLKSFITDSKATSTEYIGDFRFTNPAGAFFQNNNSILPSFTQYIRDHILPPKSDDETVPQVKYLIDAYCGSGLFTITLSSLFQSSMGIDISADSIKFADRNAEYNNIPKSQAKFIAADAPELFKSVTYPKDETVVVIDPPRKGCDMNFLNQLLSFAPKRVVYVSCNVHTQARDVGVLVEGKNGVHYEVESLRGFDFFPQTGHVEGVAVLNRVEKTVA